MHQGAELFYKCRFQTAPTLDQTDPLWAIVNQIRGWMCGKHRNLPNSNILWTKQVKYGGYLTSDDADVHIRSVICEADDGSGDLKWACRIEELIKGGWDSTIGTRLAKQTWTTEIGYRQSGEERKGEVSIITSYYNEPRFIGRVRPPVLPNVPNIVRRITDLNDLRCNVSEMPIDDMVLGVGGSSFNNSAMMFWSRVNDPGREYPIIYVGVDEKDERTIDLNELDGVIFPNALVCYPIDADAERRLMETRPSNIYCQWNGVSVYFPPRGTSVRQNGFNARKLESIRKDEWENGASKIWWGEDMPDPIVIMLRRALGEDVTFSEGEDLLTLEKVKFELDRKRYQNKLESARLRLTDALDAAERSKKRLADMRAERDARKRKQDELQASVDHLITTRISADLSESGEIRKLNDILADTKTKASSLQEEVERLEREVEDALDLAEKADEARVETARELRESRSELYCLSEQLRSYRYGENSESNESLNCILTYALPNLFSSTNTRDYPGIDKDIVHMFECVYSDRIAVMKDALKDCVTNPRLLWQGMLCMCTAVYDIYSEDQGTGSPEKRLKEQPNVPGQFELALSEGKNTKRNPKLMRLRQITYDKRVFDITPHLKSGGGKDDENSLRIYYCWDQLTGKLIIGHIGKHLLNDAGLTNKL